MNAFAPPKFGQKVGMGQAVLRKEDAKFYNYGTAIEREKQLIDKRRNIENQMLEEQVYAQLWQLDAQKKLEREMLEAKEKQEKVRDTMAVLDWQKQTREQQRLQEQEKIRREQRVQVLGAMGAQMVRGGSALSK